jgi:hypothetical protein
MVGAALAYIAGGWAIKAINAILVNAMIANQMDQQKGSGFAANSKINSKGMGSGGTDY